MRNWLKEYRLKANLTQEQVAEQVGIARATYGAIETGERNCTVANAKKLGSVLNFHWTLFFEEGNYKLKNDAIGNQICS